MYDLRGSKEILNTAYRKHKWMGHVLQHDGMLLNPLEPTRRDVGGKEQEEEGYN